MAVNLWKNARDVVAFEAGQVVFDRAMRAMRAMRAT
jgi:hypothetical protein